MEEEKTVRIEDTPGDFGFRVRFEYDSTWCEFVAFEKVSRDADGRPYFYEKDAVSSRQETISIADAEPYIMGYIKYDGCAEISFSEHLCGMESFQAHCELLKFLWNRARGLMSSSYVEEWK